MGTMSWDYVYGLWKRSYFSRNVDYPISAELIHVEWNQPDQNIYGYDWLEKHEAEKQKSYLADNNNVFDIRTPTNKGTIHTAECLVKASSDETRAAIWIAATSFELTVCELNKHVCNIAYQFNLAASAYLNGSIKLWHHSMRRLVPNILLPYWFFDSISNINDSCVMDAILMNTALLLSTHTILLYSSRESCENIRAIN